jgi:MFS family permease
MLAAVRSVWALLFGFALLMLGNGLQGSLLGLRASLEGFGTGITGLVMSAYFLGILIGAAVTPKLVLRVGHIRVFAALASLASTSILLHALFLTAPVWFAIRLVTGFCFSGLYVVAESWLNQASTNETRGKLLSIYMIISYASLGFGQLLLNVADPAGFPLFILISVLVSVALVPISLTRTFAPQIETPQAISLKQLYELSPTGFVGCLFSGLALGAFFGMGAVYGKLSGFSIGELSVLLSLPLLGVVLFQFPIGALSDRFDRRLILCVAAFASTASAIVCIIAFDYSFLAISLSFTVFGGFSMPIYSLSLAHTNDNLDLSQMLEASSKLVFVFGLGSVFGPLTAGLAMDVFGANAFFVYLAFVYAFVGCFGLYRMTQREAVPIDERGEFVLVAPRASHVATLAAVEYAEEDTAVPTQEGKN